MIAIIATHIAQEGKAQEGIEHLQRNGRMMSEYPGFRERYTLIGKDNPLQISTFTLWNSSEDAQRWNDSDTRKAQAGHGTTLWVAPPRTERFEIVP